MVVFWILSVLYIALFGICDVEMVDVMDAAPVLTTPNGDMRGVAYEVNGKRFIKYLGIRYAQPPTGPRRFRPPERPTAWSGVKEANKLGNECPQVIMPDFTFVKGLPQSEDCLFLHIYRPVPVVSIIMIPLPVMVWIHGGAYAIGSAAQYDGTYLASQGVVVVTINYRLGPFGFLSTETDEMPGNYGMLDQVQALRWVKENIAYFGGNPLQVTIFGESAGAASVSLLMLSPLSKGLFQRAILESGSSLSPWATDHPANHLTPRMLANLIGSSVGCNDYTPAELFACLQVADADAIHNASASIALAVHTSGTLAPRVENVFGFLPERPVHLLSKGSFNDVQTLRGFNTDESGKYVLDPKNEGLSLDDFKNTLHNVLFILYGFTDQNQILQKMVDIYIGNETDPFVIRDRTVEAISDFSFKGPTMNELNLIIKASPTNKHYLYEFRYRPSFVKTPSWLTAVHADEVPFVFGVESQIYEDFGIQATETDKGLSEKIISMWTNFARTGNPTATVPLGATIWKPYEEVSHYYLLMDPGLNLFSYYRSEEIAFYWTMLKKLDTSIVPPGAVIG